MCLLRRASDSVFSLLFFDLEKGHLDFGSPEKGSPASDGPEKGLLNML